MLRKTPYLKFRLGFLVPILCLASCGEEPIDRSSDEIDVREAALEALRQQLLAEAERARLAFEQMRTVQGPVVRARALGPGPIADASASQDGGGAYSRQARLLSDNSEIAMYVPDDVALSADTVVEVMVGEYGYYFVGVATDR